MIALQGFRTKYSNYPTAYIGRGFYHDGSTALMVYTEDGEPICKATVCMSDSGEKPADGNVFIKDWAENEGVMASLQAAGVIGEVIRSVPAGFCEAQECPLLIDVDDLP